MSPRRGRGWSSFPGTQRAITPGNGNNDSSIFTRIFISLFISSAHAIIALGNRLLELELYNIMPDRLVGFAMLVIATAVFVYYTIWTLIMPFVDDSHPSQMLFLPRVWAIRIPVMLILLGGAVVGSFLSIVMIRSNRKKALKAKQAKSS